MTVTKRSQIARWYWTGLFGALLFFVCYLSLKPSPASASLPWFPLPLARWFDRHDHWRNFIGFGALAFAAFKAFARWNPIAAVACCLLVVLLELSQLWLPKRTCDWADIACGCAGISFVWLTLRVWTDRQRD